MDVRRLAVVVILLATFSPIVQAHEVRPAYLQLRQTRVDTFDVLWKVPAIGDNLRLGLYVRFPESCEIDSEPTGMFVGNAYVERLTVRDPKSLVGSTIHIDGLRTTLTDVLVRIERLDGTTQVARLMPEFPSLLVEASPSVWQVAWTYLVLGVEHILGGIDHILFVLALMLIVGRHWGLLIKTITAFTVAHSITLALATLGLVHVPQAPVEAVIALSIMFVASEILHTRAGRPGLTARAPWVVAFLFGLLHGFGFASALSEIGLPQNSIPLALLLFNVGVEIGQLVFVGIALSIISLVLLVKLPVPAWTRLLPPYAIGTVAVFWLIQRVATF
jgi:hypothetical protein